MPKFVSSDGREFTSYISNCDLNQSIQQKYKLSNSHEYRAFLQRNATQVMTDLAQCDTKQECLLCPVCKNALDVGK